MLTQSRAPVLLTEQPLRRRIGSTCSMKLSSRDGSAARHDVEAVGGTALEPGDDRVGRLVGCTDEGEVSATAAQPREDLADGQVLSRCASSMMRSELLWAPSSFGRARMKSGSGLSSSNAGRVGLRSSRPTAPARIPALEARRVAVPARWPRSSVDPMIGTMPGSTSTPSGSRPAAFVRALMSRVEVGGALVGLVCGEDGFRVAGGEVLAVLRGPRLHQQRVALRRALHVERARDLEVVAVRGRWRAAATGRRSGPMTCRRERLRVSQLSHSAFATLRNSSARA